MTNLDKYPNLEAILSGAVAGSFRDWLAVRPELEKLVAEMDEVDKLRERIDELETVLKKVQQWGADARSADSYEVFHAVRMSLIDLAPSREVKVVGCTCVPCICFAAHEVVLGSYCLGCGARTCLAHELAKTSSRPSQATKSREDPE